MAKQTEAYWVSLNGKRAAVNVDDAIKVIKAGGSVFRDAYGRPLTLAMSAQPPLGPTADREPDSADAPGVQQMNRDAQGEDFSKSRPGYAARTVGNLLPTAGGVAGELLGGPIGSAVGAGAGELLRQGIYQGQGIPVANPWQNVGIQAAMGGLGSLAGRGVSALADNAAKPLAQAAVGKPSATIMRQFPGMDFAQGLLDNGVASSAEARAAAKPIMAQRAGALGWASNMGLNYTPQQLIGNVADFMNTLKASTAKGADQAEMQRYIDNFIADHAGVLDAEDADAIKRFAQSASKNTISGRQLGNNVAATDANWKLFNDTLQQKIRARLANDVPGLDEANAKLQSLMGVRRALANAEGRRLPFGAHAALTVATMGPALMHGAPLQGAAALGAGELAAHAINNPNNLARAALAAQQVGSPAFRRILALSGAGAGPSVGTMFMPYPRSE